MVKMKCSTDDIFLKYLIVSEIGNMVINVGVTCVIEVYGEKINK